MQPIRATYERQADMRERRRGTIRELLAARCAGVIVPGAMLPPAADGP